MNLSTFVRLLCVAACAFPAIAAWADPPAQVGRIAYIEGDVSLFTDREDGWRKAELNYPVTSENSLWTGANARSEVRIGPSAIRVDAGTVFDFVKLQDDVALGFLQRGAVSVRLRQFGNIESSDMLQIDTSEGRFTLEGNGRYRLDVADGGEESRVVVFSGRARFDSADSRDTRLTIDAGKQLTVRVTGSATDFRYDAAIDTPFDRWADARDQSWDHAHQRYAYDQTRETLISPYMTGYEDLDANGDWLDDNEYGRLWAPRGVVSGWAPYRYGRWSYVRPWGWTWIDDAPWGFAPFHYGRWVQVRSRWCWWPGPYVGRPVYAPALVAWLGSPGGTSLTISSGPAVGWFPLAPREYYIPRYATDPRYIRRINHVTNNNTVINPPTRYRNQVPGATIVSNQVFVRGNPVGGRSAHLPPQAIGGHAPLPSLDIPRPPRNAGTVIPDLRQEGRPGNPSPRPRFSAETTPAPVPAQGPASPVTQTPKYRTPPPGAGGPLPAQRPGSSAIPAPVPAPGAPAFVPGSRSQPAPVPPPASGTARPGGIPVEPAPVTRDRESRPEGRSPGARGGNRPQPDVQSPQPAPPPAPIVAPRAPSGHPQPVLRDGATVVRPMAPIPPIAAPRPQSTHPQPVTKEAAPPAPPSGVRPVPEAVPRVRLEIPAEPGQGKNENRDARGRPGIAKD